MREELRDENLLFDFDEKLYPELIRVCKKFNAYIWCSKMQLPKLLDYFVTQKRFLFNVLIWKKDNPTPVFNNSYLPDKEYCLYFREEGTPLYLDTYEKAKTIFTQPINKKDKDKYNHPTIKPLDIIQTLIENSSREGDTIFDPFMGSGTTGVACSILKRNFIGMEINDKFFEMAKTRIELEERQLKMF